MPTAYCVVATSVNAFDTSEHSGWSFTKPGGVGAFIAAHGVAGATTAKSPIVLGSSFQLDTSPIPLNAIVLRSKLVLTANTTETSVFDSRVSEFVSPLAPPTRDSVTEAVHTESQFLCRARDSSSAQLALAGATIDFDQASRTDLGSTSFGQVLVLTSTGTGLLSTVSMWLRRVGSDGSVFARVYSVQGDSGRYTRDQLLATSTARPTSDIASGAVATEFELTLPSPLSVSSGDIFIVEVAFSDPPDGIWSCFFGGDSSLEVPQGNSLSFGPSLQGFSPQIYLSGRENATANGFRFVAENFVFPSFTAGAQYEFGDASYSPDVTWVAFNFMVQRALDGRDGHNRFPLTIQGFSVAAPPASGDERRWRSSQHGTPQIVDGNSYFGPVLVVEYFVPIEAIGYIVQIAEPEVSVGIATASIEAELADATAVATIQAASRAVIVQDHSPIAQIQAATLAVPIADPGLSVEVATPIADAALSDATTIIQPETAPEPVLVHASTLGVRVQAATLVVEVQAATLATRVPISPDGGPATEETVADLLDISPAEVDVEVTRRDSTPFSFTLQDENGNAIDITSYTSFTLTVDPSDEPEDTAENLFKITAAFPAPLTGVIVFSPTILNHTQDPGDYFFDVEQIDGSSNVRTIIKGKYKILPDITQP